MGCASCPGLLSGLSKARYVPVGAVHRVLPQSGLGQLWAQDLDKMISFPHQRIRCVCSTCACVRVLCVRAWGNGEMAFALYWELEKHRISGRRTRGD